ncbi:MAG: hypothetical protein IKR25_01635 [Muribaculaceae bacterium]|nr:hypothetical protein [Muribaculaceae bacterium]
MKKIAVALMCMILATGTAVARNYDADEPKSEISVGYGLPLNASNMCEFLAAGWTGGLSNKDLDKDRYVGPLTLEYFYHVTPVIGVGAVGVYSYHKGVYVNAGTPEDQSSTYLTIMPSVKVNWLRRDNWGLYSKIAFGYSYCKYKNAEEGKEARTDTGSCANFQASIIGAEVGGRSVRGFVELGFGEQGVGLAGVRFRF